MHHFFATAAKGTEGALRDELRALRLPRVRADRGGVHFEGRLEDGMRACLWSRIAMRILLQLGELEARGTQGFYDAIRSFPWEDHLSLRRTFAIRATVRDSELTHSHFVALKAKDAIVDRLREKLGGRPDVDADRPDVSVVIHLAKDVAQLSLDLAGAPLHMRGWRVEAKEAPLRETLAAAMLALGRYDPALPFLDPMCGSGTLAIEAAQIARKIAPGRGRHFGFMRWPAFGDEESKAFRALQEDAKAVALPKAPAPILARDRFADPLEVTERNLHRAGVTGSVELEQRDTRDLGSLPPRCQIFVNPPYGERLGGKRLQLEGLYRGFGQAYAPLEPEHRLVVLSGSPYFERAFGARVRARHRLFNGPLEVDLLSYGPMPA
ncbi:THUMP domain-containing class I SAM-dependent RNA methyltransferase [Vulgatibacter incomptus]|nr:THUMP domain-containing protein [Vulgatibacter incomptus]